MLLSTARIIGTLISVIVMSILFAHVTYNAGSLRFYILCGVGGLWVELVLIRIELMCARR